MANRNITFKVINARKVSFAELAADIAIGYTNDAGQFIGLFVVPDFLLKKSPTKGYYYQGPSKPYIKDGEHLVDDNGYKRYLEFFRLYSEMGAGDDPSKSSPTKNAFEARKHIIAILVEAMNQLGGDSGASSSSRAPGRAPSRPAAATAPARSARPAKAQTQIEEEEVAAPGDDDDDSMPF